jgi:hypothetical protein
LSNPKETLKKVMSLMAKKPQTQHYSRGKMANLPYRFHTPVPRYFSDIGWLNPKKSMYFKTLAFLTWSFARCNLEPRIICWDDKEIKLEPFEFICGRITCSEEMGLTQDELRTQIKKFINARLLEKTPNSSPNRFTCYKWLTARFTQEYPQQNPRPAPNSPLSHPHKRNEKTERPSEIKDDSFGVCGNVHNSFKTNLQTSMIDDLPKYFYEYKFQNGSTINPKVLIRWLRDYEHEAIYKALRYYEKMFSKNVIPKPEAYVQKVLTNRFWESDELRLKCNERETMYNKQKHSNQ